MHRLAATLDIPEQFNAATWLVDRHFDEGRAAQTAILYEGQAITLRPGRRERQPLRQRAPRLGVGIEQRVLSLLLDSPEFVYAFFGAMKIGAGSHSHEHESAPGRLPVSADRLPRGGRW